uniref:CSON009575 protein n=1 Tax=Culicoides sonorensis TaxID=179676 RepID=A0A336M4B4_CULSO
MSDDFVEEFDTDDEDQNPPPTNVAHQDSTNVLTNSENTNNENREKELNQQQTTSSSETPDNNVTTTNEGNSTSTTDESSYIENTTYTDDGTAIYTDPQTKYQYKWCTTENKWIPYENSATNSNPYENEYYFWCTEKNSWQLKANYDYDENQKKWIPKEGISEETFGQYKIQEIDGVRTYTDNDGVAYEWDDEKKAWFPKIDDDFMAIYQLNYGNYVPTEADKEKERKKRKLAESADVSSKSEDDTLDDVPREVVNKKMKKKPEPPKWFEIAPEHNNKVYVDNLPLDMSEEDFVQLMSKYGMIFKDPTTNKYKVKLYRTPEGDFKGDALCTYIKVESVDLAINLLDGYKLGNNTLKVQRAEFQMRGEYNPALKPKQKKKEKEKMKKLQEKLLDWRPDKMRGERSRHERIVVIKNLFEPQLFDTKCELILEYQNDLRDECSKCGNVRKVVIYDRHPEGVAQVIMADPEEADIVVKLLNGRYFGQRQLTAYSWDGKEKFKISETDAEMEARLSQWDKYLESSESTETIPNEES